MNKSPKAQLENFAQKIAKSLDIQILTSVLLTSCIQSNINSFISATINLANLKMCLPVEKEEVTFSQRKHKKKRN